MPVTVVRLSGLGDDEAAAAASAVVDDIRTYPDVRKMLVLDDTSALLDHVRAYERLRAQSRVERLVCVASGPRPAEGTGNFTQKFRLPGNLRQGTGVLWVSDPDGVDWRLSPAASVVGHADGGKSGYDHLVGLLSVETLFDSVFEEMIQVPGGVASPGLRLSGTDSEADSFAAALVLAIERIAVGGGKLAGGEEPFGMLVQAVTSGGELAEGGELEGLRNRAIESARLAQDTLAGAAGLGRLFGRGKVAENAIVTAGEDLQAFRDRVARLFTEAHSPGELTPTGRRRVTAAGVRLSDQVAASPAEEPAHKLSAVYKVIEMAVKGGDPLPHVIRRLSLTERELKHRGSIGYLPDLDGICPPGLLDRLRDPAGLLSRRGEARAAVDDALRAAEDLGGLIVRVSNREWSGAVSAVGEMSKQRIALDGICARLMEHVSAAGDPGTARAKRLGRLSDNLAPVLSDLVLRVIAAEADIPSDGGQGAYEQAQAKTAALLEEWTQLVAADGVLAHPPWATSVVASVRYTAEDELAEIKDAVLYDPAEEMWQLCAPRDLNALNMAVPPSVVRFAPRLNQNSLSDVLPRGTAWAPSGSYAGLLRLVPLRDGLVSTTWTTGAPSSEAS